MLPFEVTPGESGREKVNRVQSGDDLATDQQLLQIVAVAQFFVRQDAKPEVFSNRAVGVRFNHSRVQHSGLLAADVPRCLAAEIPNPKQQKSQWAGLSKLWDLGFGISRAG